MIIALIAYLLFALTSVHIFRKHVLGEARAVIAWPLSVLLAFGLPIWILLHVRKSVLRAVVFPT